MLLPNLSKVYAQAAGPPPPPVVGPPPGDPWVEVSHCGPNQIQPNDIRGIILKGDKTKMIEILNEARACLTTQDIEIGAVKSNNMAYCDLSQGLTTPYNKDMSQRMFIGKYCCPKTHPITRRLREDVCCPSMYEPDVINVFSCKSVDGGASVVQGKKAVSTSVDTNFNSGPPVVGGSGPVYECPQLGCLTDGNSNIITNNTDKNPLLHNAQNPLTNRLCYAMNSQKNGDNTKYCLAGKWVSEEEKNAAGLNNAVIQCARLAEGERERCFDCFGKNPPNDAGEPQTYVYSSLGCINTDRDAFITRLFQLGFGLLSGFAIVRIMVAAVNMQSSDPTKHKEGRDMAVSAIVALVTLAAAIPILRYLGINLLSILPFDFLS